MKLKYIWFAAISVVALSSRGWSAMGVAMVKGTTDESEISGNLKFEDTAQGLKITGTIENVPSGEHAFHIHEFGDCGDEGKAAGSHYNPDQKPHGMAMKDGTMKVHPGDMGNLTANEKGMADVNVLLPNVALSNGKYTVAGRAVILHEKKDDFGQPTGNAGNRIGCGSILLTGK
jgi:Cu-Zn family superoxide dismutase